MNRYVLDRLMRDSRDGQGRRQNGQFAADSRDRARGRDSRGNRDSRSDRAYSGDYRDRRSGRDGDYYDDYDRRESFEYNSGNIELSERDLEDWRRRIKNANGARGARFTEDQAVKAGEQIGVKFEHFTEQEFAMALNMLYADFSKVMEKAGVPNAERPELYAHMAKAWLCDDDFEGEPYEKLALYYYAIVDFEE